MTLPTRRQGGAFFCSALIGSLGGLIGLGGAEFRLPLLVGVFSLPTLEAVILNKAISLVVVASAMLFRSHAIELTTLYALSDVILNLLAGSLLGAWWAAGYMQRLPAHWLNRIILCLLLGLAMLMLSEAFFPLRPLGQPLLDNPWLLRIAGVVAGLGIGAVAAVLGVAGGELLIPTGVLLFGLDIKLAGSVSLAVSLPTMLVGFLRYRQASAFSVLGKERGLLWAMVAGSILGSALGARALGIVSSHLLMVGLGGILLISAYKVFTHARHAQA